MLREDYVDKLKRFKESNADRYGIARIGIFGSVARQEETPNSDVDVCVELKKPDLFYMVHIKEEKRNSNQCCKF